MDEVKHPGLHLQGKKGSHLLPFRSLQGKGSHYPPADPYFTGGSVPSLLHEHTKQDPADVQGSSPLLLPGDHKTSLLTSPDLCYLNIHQQGGVSHGGQLGSHHSILQTLKQDASCGSYISLPGSEVKAIGRHQQQRVVEKEKDVTLTCSVDKAFRTAVMFMSFFALGLVNGVLGPTLIELQTIASTSTTKAALLFTWGAVGRIPGSLGTAFVFDKYSPALLLGGAVLLFATSTCLLPWCYKYSVMATVIVVQGIGIGSLGSGCTAYCFQLWTSKAAPFVQALGFIMALGNTCAPLLAKPFLSQTPLTLTPTDLNVTLGEVTTLSPTLAHLSEVVLLSNVMIEPNISDLAAVRSSPLNQVKVTGEVKPEQFSVRNSSYSTNLLSSEVPKIAPPYLIISSLHLLSSLLYMLVYIQDKTRAPKLLQSAHPVSVPLQAIPAPDPIHSHLLCVLFGIFMFCCAGLEVTYGGLLLTYVVEYLNWTKSLAAYLTFAYWMCVAFGRGIGVILVKYLSPPTIVTVDIIGACASLVILAACSHLHVIVQWVCTCLLGLSISTLVAATLNLAYRYLQLSGKLTAIFMCCNYAGIMVLPGVTGALFRRVSGQAFILSQMVTTAVMICVFIAIQAYYYKVTHHCTSDNDDNDEVDDEDVEQADCKHYADKSRYLKDV